MKKLIVLLALLLPFSFCKAQKDSAKAVSKKPAPCAVLVGTFSNGETVELQKLLSADELRVADTANCKVTILNYDISIMKNGKEMRMGFSGNKLSVGAKKFLSQLQPGNLVFFENIVAKDNLGLIKRLEALKLAVKGGE